jgi:hypothetical protein
MSYFI